MSTLNLELYDALISANADEEKARKAASTLPADIATRRDIKGMETRLIRWVVGVLATQTVVLGGFITWIIERAGS